MSTPMKMRTEVIATVRNPDGDPSAEIEGLVLRQRGPSGGWWYLTKAESIEWASERLLWCRVPGDGRQVEIEAVDGDGDGRADFVRTVPDNTKQNNLLWLPIFDRRRTRWVDARGHSIAAVA